MWEALCRNCAAEKVKARLALEPLEECTKGHGERVCKVCGARFTGGCTDTLSSGDYAGHAKANWACGDPCASQWFGFPGNGRNFADKCPCGNVATHMDPHNDGDCPLEYCADCYGQEVARLEKEYGKPS